MTVGTGYIKSYIDTDVQTPTLGLPWPDVGELERLHREVVPPLN